jgi:succinoglycan biosynthesis protein ExoA
MKSQSTLPPNPPDRPGGPLVTVVIPTYNEERYIETCLGSVLAQQGLPGEFEVLLLDGGSTDKTRELVAEIARKDPRVRLVENPEKVQVFAFNRGIREGQGEYVALLGAHAEYDPDYLSTCYELLLSSGASNVGGVQTSVGEGLFGSAVAWAMSSPFGVGNSRFRYAKTEEFADSVFGGFYRRDTLLALGGFNEKFVVNEDYELNRRLRLDGGKILLSPRVRFRYFVRSSPRGLARQMFRYGFWRVQTQCAHPDEMLLRHLAPPILVVGLPASFAVAVGAGVLPGLSPFLGLLAAVMPALYALYLAMGALSALRSTKSLVLAVSIPLVLATMQISWGLGWWLGVRRFGIPRTRASRLLGRAPA